MDLEILAYIGAALMVVLAYLAYRYWHSTATYARRMREAHAHQVLPPLQVSTPSQNVTTEPDVLSESDGDDDGDVAAVDFAEPDPDLVPSDQAIDFDEVPLDDSSEPSPGSEEAAAAADEPGSAQTAEPTRQEMAPVIDGESAEPPDGEEPASAENVETMPVAAEDRVLGTDPLEETLGPFAEEAPVEQLDENAPVSTESESTETEIDDIAPESDLDSTEETGPIDPQSPPSSAVQEDPGDEPPEEPDQEPTTASTGGVAAEDAEGPQEAPVPSDEEEDLLQDRAYRLIDELEPRTPSSRVVEVSGSVAALLKELDEKLEALPSGIELIDMPILERRRISDRREELLSDRQLLLEQKRRGAHRRRRRSRAKKPST